jgi:hypothetical protein
MLPIFLFLVLSILLPSPSQCTSFVTLIETGCGSSRSENQTTTLNSSACYPSFDVTKNYQVHCSSSTTIRVDFFAANTNCAAANFTTTISFSSNVDYNLKYVFNTPNCISTFRFLECTPENSTSLMMSTSGTTSFIGVYVGASVFGFTIFAMFCGYYTSIRRCCCGEDKSSFLERPAPVHDMHPAEDAISEMTDVSSPRDEVPETITVDSFFASSPPHFHHHRASAFPRGIPFPLPPRLNWNRTGVITNHARPVPMVTIDLNRIRGDDEVVVMPTPLAFGQQRKN